jgi:hypothetical protein
MKKDSTAQKALRERAKRLDRLVAIMRNPLAKHTDQIAAISRLLERGWGRAPQAVDLSMKFQNLEELSDAELTAIIRAGDHEGSLANVTVRNGSADRSS